MLVSLQDLDHESGHNIIKYVDSFTFRGFFCIVMELLSLDVYTVLKAQSYSAFSMSLIHSVATETVEAIEFIHSRGIVHCDIKPENILFTDKTRTHVKVIDYGCSCYVGKIQYSYVQSRYYRAPEVVLGLEYGPEIDIWSLACVLVEMRTGRPLFPANNEQELIHMIVRLRGLPPLSFLRAAPRADHYFDETGQLRQKSEGTGKVLRPGSLSLRDATKVKDAAFLDLIDGCLKWVPAERLTAHQFMNHSWIKQDAASARSAR
jgi:dual specificity tyrosine-phosphorylation-regulated kinase 2/3/4